MTPFLVATTASVLPLSLSFQEHTKALPLYIDVLAKRRAHLGDDYDLSPENPSPEPGAAMLTTLTNLALCYDTMGEHDQAEPLYLESLDGRRQLLGDMHPSTLTSLHNAGESGLTHHGIAYDTLSHIISYYTRISFYINPHT